MEVALWFLVGITVWNNTCDAKIARDIMDALTGLSRSLEVINERLHELGGDLETIKINTTPPTPPKYKPEPLPLPK